MKQFKIKPILRALVSLFLIVLVLPLSIISTILVEASSDMNTDSVEGLQLPSSPEEAALYPHNFDMIKYLNDNPNDYQQIWEPWLSKAAVHAIVASEDGEFLAVGGGYLADNEIHIFRWNPETLEYDRVWDSGDGILKRDVLSLAWGDTDNNKFMEIIAGSADGHVYVFEQRHVYDPFTKTENQFRLVWVSPKMRPVFSVRIDDMDKDLIKDLVVGAWDGVHVFEYKSHSGYPFSKEHWIEYKEVWNSGNVFDDLVCSIATGNLHNNGLPEIIAGTRNGTIYIFENNGTVLDVRGEPFPLTKDNDYYLNATLEGCMWKPIMSLDAGNLDNDPGDEVVAMALGQGVYVLNAVSSEYVLQKLTRPLESWETPGSSSNSLDYFIDANLNATNVFFRAYFRIYTEPLSQENLTEWEVQDSISPWNTAMAKDDRWFSTFAPKLDSMGRVIESATALLDFGKDEEATGNGNNLPEVSVAFLSTQGSAAAPNFDNLVFSVSQDGLFFVKVNTTVEAAEVTWTPSAADFNVSINLDPILYRNRWDYVRYLNITVSGTQRYAVGSVQTNTLYRPIDTATVAGIRHLELDNSDLKIKFKARLNAYTTGTDYDELLEDSGYKEEPNRIVIGTVDGRLMVFAYDETTKSYAEVWDSYLGENAPPDDPLGSHPNAFNLKTNIWAIQEVKSQGKIPTWVTSENFQTVNDPPISYKVSTADYASMVFADVNRDWRIDMILGTTSGELKAPLNQTIQTVYLSEVNNYYANNYDNQVLSAAFAQLNQTSIFSSSSISQQQASASIQSTIPIITPTPIPSPIIRFRPYYDPLELIVGYLEPGIAIGNPADDTFVGVNAGIDYWSTSPGKKYSSPKSLEALEVTGELTRVLGKSATLPKVALADVDGDGDLDLTVTNGRIYYLENIGNETDPKFALKPEYYLSINTGSPDKVFSGPQLVDFNLDGMIDLVVGFANKYGATYFENTGTAKSPIWVERKKLFSNPERNFKLANFTDPVFYYTSELYDLLSSVTVNDIPVSKDNFVKAYRDTFGTTYVMSAYNNVTHEIVTFLGDTESHSRFIVGTNPRIIRLEVALGDGPLWNFGYNVFETWNNDEELDDWTVTVETGDVDQDQKNEVIIGDFDNNLYVFEHLTNNTYKRAFRSFDFNHTVKSDKSPYKWEELEGLSGNFNRTIWDHVQNLIVDTDLDNDTRREIVVTADLSIYVFEQRALGNETIGDEYDLVWRTDLRKSTWGAEFEKLGFDIITALSFSDDLDGNRRGEIIAASGSYLFVFESQKDATFEEVYFGDAPLGRYLLPGNPRVTVGSVGYGNLLIRTVVTGDTDSDGFEEIIVGGVRNETQDGLVQHGYVGILENHIGTYQLAWTAPKELTNLNPVNTILVDDQDYDGRKELIIGHEHGIDIFEWSGTDNSYVKMEVITSSPNYPVMQVTSMFNGEGPHTIERKADIFQLENGTLIQIYTNYTGTQDRLPNGTQVSPVRLFFKTSNNDGMTWANERRLTADANYGSRWWIVKEHEPSITEVDRKIWFAWRIEGIYNATSGNFWRLKPAHAIFARSYSFAVWSLPETISSSGTSYRVVKDGSLHFPAIYQNQTSIGVSYLDLSNGCVDSYVRGVGGGWIHKEIVPFIGLASSYRYEASSIDVITRRDGGRALVFGGRFKNESKNDYDIWTMITNATMNWNRPVRLTSKSTDEGNPSITQLKSKDGTLVVLFESYGGLRGESIQISYSKDEGHSWSLPELVPSLPPYVEEHIVAGVIYYKIGTRFVTPPWSFGPSVTARKNQGFIYSLTTLTREPYYFIYKKKPTTQAWIDIVVGVNPSSKWADNEMRSVRVMATGDTDNDGRKEIAADFGNKATLFELAHADAARQDHQQVWTSQEFPEPVTDISIGDANGNGWPEIVVSAKKGNVYSYEISNTNPPKASLRASAIVKEIPVSQAAINVAGDLASGNFDADAKKELAVIADKEIIGYEADGTRLWTYRTDYTIRRMKIIDLNKDGVDDVVVGDSSGVYAVNGIDGTTLWNLTIFGEPQPAYVNHLAIGDFDGDKSDDVALATPNKVYTFDGLNPGPIWSAPISIPSFITGLSVGNLTGDSKTDIVVSTVYGAVYALNGADGSLLWPLPFQDPKRLTIFAPALSDFNLDGLDDVVVAGGFIYALDGSSGKQIWNNTEVSGNPSVTFSADFTGDGTSDVVAGYINYTTSVSQIVAVDGSIGKTLWSYETMQDWVKSLVVTDLDNDDMPDVASIHNELSSNSYALVALDSNGMTAWLFSKPLEPYLLKIAAGDFDGDGRVEAAAIGGRGTVYIVHEVRLGSRSVSSPVSMLEPAWKGKTQDLDVTLVASGDLDGDRVDDVVASTAAASVTAFSGSKNQVLWSYGITHFIHPNIAFLTTARIDSSKASDVILFTSMWSEAKSRIYRITALKGESGLPIWEVNMSAFDTHVDAGYVVSSLEVKDLDGDGLDEVIVAGIIMSSLKGFVFAMDNTFEDPLSGRLWAVFSPFPIWMTKTLDSGVLKGYTFALSYNGTSNNMIVIRNGITTASFSLARPGVTMPYKTMQLGLLDSDNYPDAVLTTSGSSSVVVAVNLKASIDARSPKYLWGDLIPYYIRSVAIANITGVSSNKNDVAILGWTGYISVHKGQDGVLFSKFSNPVVYSTPIPLDTAIDKQSPLLVADTNGDALSEVVTVNWEKVYAVNARARVVWASPVFSDKIAAATLGDFDGDKYPDVAVGTRDGFVYIILDSVKGGQGEAEIKQPIESTSARDVQLEKPATDQTSNGYTQIETSAMLSVLMIGVTLKHVKRTRRKLDEAPSNIFIAHCVTRVRVCL